ncbi:unnamed protein product [Cuscuta epithymum]|uniref:Peptidase A1 domain-containing protein n=1 Tax=Cuscuta epithymum TaxID=186058 RepID=A0AAV0GGU1_9ASTE|nr:unnamed protein product [Cuscuta epithymum]
MVAHIPCHQLLLSLLFLFLFISSAAVAASSITRTSATHEDFKVEESISLATKILPPNPQEFDDGNLKVPEQGMVRNWKLKILHRDRLTLPRISGFRNRFESRMKRDENRVSTLIRRIRGGGSGGSDGGENASIETAAYEVEGFGTEVVSGVDEGSGEYFVRIGVGIPATYQYMVIDSGSDILWVQCQPCTQCYHQSDPIFDPSLSASFAGMPCNSFLCDQIENSGCNSGRCEYKVRYGDGSYTKGMMASETLTFGETVVRNVAIGCGHSNRGMFTGAAGLLGLAGGSMSLVGQLRGETGGAFSYCLVTRGTESTGSLEFGRGAFPVGAAWVPLIRNTRAPSFYYIGLSGLGVGGVRVPIPEDVFGLTDLGDGGVIMDTGTAVTRFPTVAYIALRDAFVNQTARLPRAPNVSIFDTCYDLNGFVTVRVPTVSFFFTGCNTILTLPATNFLLPVDEKGTFCFAFAPSPNELSIIGNIQQQGIQISFDDPSGFVGFGPNIC